jgi:hypothetical protein
MSRSRAHRVELVSPRDLHLRPIRTRRRMGAGTLSQLRAGSAYEARFAWSHPPVTPIRDRTRPVRVLRGGRLERQRGS